MLATRSVLRKAVWAGGAAVLLGWAFAFGRGYYVS